MRLLSPPVRALVRQVDCVVVKGSKQPVGLFTYDLSTDGLEEAFLAQPQQVGTCSA